MVKRLSSFKTVKIKKNENCWSISSMSRSREISKVIMWSCFHLTIFIIFHIRRLKLEILFFDFRLPTRTILWCQDTLTRNKKKLSVCVRSLFWASISLCLRFSICKEEREKKKTSRSSFTISSSCFTISVDVDNKIINCGIQKALLVEAREEREK